MKASELVKALTNEISFSGDKEIALCINTDSGREESDCDIVTPYYVASKERKLFLMSRRTMEFIK